MSRDYKSTCQLREALSDTSWLVVNEDGTELTMETSNIRRLRPALWHHLRPKQAFKVLELLEAKKANGDSQATEFVDELMDALKSEPQEQTLYGLPLFQAVESPRRPRRKCGKTGCGSDSLATNARN